ncbi:hypothetical protein A0J48_009795 [Sphaerospermopsis aphanizomenoides BCCUSP55]|uniref:hypothetical protein n=1 Tax=Sphaerospermopsis aphanizomenoides TaxID=459663 RepID=UPI001907E074|nr:hypothetical protein [Sphaerospermopsis aphanizomenoides]MBK1987827.1 hypothetical protein [Sphaerospermopsis aphanizomenoides BCCUSP55]
MLENLKTSQIISSQWSGRTIATVTNTLNKAQGYLENSWQTATQITNNASGVIENTITGYIHDLPTQNPKFLHFLQTLNWTINHPIISGIILLFIIACTGGIIKRIFYLIETASWSILKIPLNLGQILSKAIFLALANLTNGNKQKTENNKIRFVETISYQDKQTRLTEIYQRLEIIHNEQQQLLQEAAKLIDSDRENR